MLAKLNEVLEFDADGRVAGLQFNDRARAIAEWRDRLEEREFQRLVTQLQKRNSARRSAATEAGKARVKENTLRYRQKHLERLRSLTQKRRSRRYYENPVVNRCHECGKLWTPPYEQKVKRSKYCSRRCRNRDGGRRRKRSKGLRQMDLRCRVLECLGNQPRTAAGVATFIGAKLGSIRTCLCRWAASGAIESAGGKPAMYSLPVNISAALCGGLLDRISPPRPKGRGTSGVSSRRAAKRKVSDDQPNPTRTW